MRHDDERLAASLTLHVGVNYGIDPAYPYLAVREVVVADARFFLPWRTQVRMGDMLEDVDPDGLLTDAVKATLTRHVPQNPYVRLAEELRGFAEGSTSARASLMRDAAEAIEALGGKG